MLVFSAVLLTFGYPALGALYSNPTDLPSTSYDYVVVGAGVGGGVIAGRLAELQNVRVLLIEAGPDNRGLEAVAVPFLCTTLSPNTVYDWNYTTTPQTGLFGRSIAYPRGRLLGGSSSTNYLGWTRGSQDDYDRMARASGDERWSWKALEPMFRKVEQLLPPPDGHNTAGQIDPSVHGRAGPLGVVVGSSLPIDDMVINVTKQLPEFPFNLDMNSGKPIGLGYSQASMRNGSRESSATAYIHPALAAANLRLDVLVNAHVTKLLQTGHEDGLPALRGVQFAAVGNATFHTVNATREVILSAGAVATPQILMLSGIGNATHLNATGIVPLVHLPAVGQNLQDHVSLRSIFLVNSTDITYDDLHRNAALNATMMSAWERTRSGNYSSPPTAQIGWFKVPRDALGSLGDASAGPTSPHYEIVFVDGYSGASVPETGRYLSIVSVVVSPSARGSITLASASPFANPVIDLAFLSTPADILVAREAVKAVQRLAAAPAFKDYIVAPVGAFANVSTDDQIDAYVRGNSDSLWHPAGTARMAPFGSSEGVVNPDLTVKKMRGLRVVDTSIYPFIPAAHLQAGLYAVAEQAANIIKASVHRP
ncbi:GMC oxidoreductase [Auriscalpium vulgare]|uniref:GMC oxidoreductase n=1 Tax=Auriscalpium vulgare TaxID=40419 RepID=A0ACB8R971_9AGAM|nr:GMC oxidoreductase [Auriscalpium vulgare]